MAEPPIAQLNVPGVTWTCRSTPHRSHPPPSPFPASPILSPLGLRLRAAESTWDAQRRRRGQRIRVCAVPLSSSMPGRGVAAEGAAAREGWRFVRAAYEGKESAAVGWGVYELSLAAS